jgi:hypothetical protein
MVAVVVSDATVVGPRVKVGVGLPKPGVPVMVGVAVGGVAVAVRQRS